ncbi:unnamed protein product [Phytophthora lilii]|uniref:Unnamed protein product n=1 Tax=Phytophthora lilii TaxID=2077276 RepID=A0A9W6TVS1_9STRA|nr:unnamed protein product [Phytophthora lilii]
MTSPSPELMEKLFKTDNSKHCVDFLNRIGCRIMYPMDPGDTEASFISFWDDLIHQNAMRIIFKPRGQENKARIFLELFHALANVPTSIDKLHAASWMHRDIRWPNVIKSRDGDNSWFLIDFMDAAQSPLSSPSGGHLSRAERAPEIFSNISHTTAVDVWAVGRLIQTCGDVYGSWYDTGRVRSQFLEQLMDNDPAIRPAAA